MQAKKSITDRRMKLYKFICFSGTAIMLLVDKAALLNRVYEYSHTAARLCTLYLTFALMSMLLGMTASSFPDSAPFGMPIAWNGTLQAFLSLNAFFHMRIIEVYPELLQLTLSFLVTSVLFSIYWTFHVRDARVRSLIAVQSWSHVLI